VRRKDLRNARKHNREIYRADKKRYTRVTKARKSGRFRWSKNEKRWLWLLLGLFVGFCIFSILGGILEMYSDSINSVFPEWININEGLDFMLPIVGFIILGAVGLGTYLNKDTIGKMTDSDPTT